MTFTDWVFLRLRSFLLRSDVGRRFFRFLRWFFSLVAPYTPPRATIPPDRANAYVKVDVRPSTIPGAGQGLFALEPIDVGVLIGEYVGDVVTSVLKAMRLRNKDYLFSTSTPSVMIDGSNRLEAMMRYICHHPRAEKRNVQFLIEGKHVFVKTIRPVFPEDEFFADYGGLYWQVRGVVPRE
jgi:uncharacterized protein